MRKLIIIIIAIGTGLVLFNLAGKAVQTAIQDSTAQASAVTQYQEVK